MDALIFLFVLLILIVLGVFSFRWYVIGRKTFTPPINDRDPELEAERVREIRERLSAYAGHPEHALEVRERLHELVTKPLPLDLDDPIPYPEKGQEMAVHYIPPEQAEDLLWLFKRGSDSKDAPTAS